MAGRRSRAKREEVDDVVLFPASILDDQDDAEASFREFVMRAGNIADARRMCLPVTGRLLDSDGQCFWGFVLAGDESTVDKLLLQGARRPSPWFLVLEDANHQCVKARLEIGEQRSQ